MSWAPSFKLCLLSIFSSVLISNGLLLFPFGGFVYSSDGRKVDDPELLEAIRLTIINNLLEYHPVIMILHNLLLLKRQKIEHLLQFLCLFNLVNIQLLVQESSAQLAMGAAFGVSPPTKEVLNVRLGEICGYVWYYLSCGYMLIIKDPSITLSQFAGCMLAWVLVGVLMFFLLGAFELVWIN